MESAKKATAIALAIFALSAQCASASDNIIEVCSTCSFQTIKSALKAAKTNSTIKVHAGEYHEGPLTIDRTLKLEGAPGAVIDGDKEYQPLTIRADNVEVSSFEIRNSGSSFTQEIAGIKAINAKNCKIESNQFKETTYGVYLDNSEGCLILKNAFKSSASAEVSAGNGVHIWYGSGHTIQENKIDGHRDGIYLEFVTGAKIYKNLVRHALRYGLHFMQSHSGEYIDNIFTQNGAGVAVMYGTKILMKNNLFQANSGPAAYGLLLKEIRESEILENVFHNNTVGIFMESSNRNNFHDNYLKNNGWALRIMGDCEQNNFTHNEFTENSFDVATNSSRNPNTFTENYWSRYNGYDLDHDGIGDVPYRPVSLSSVIMESIDSAYVLVGSTFFQVIDRIEQALPDLIPEPLRDDKPLLMKRERKS